MDLTRFVRRKVFMYALFVTSFDIRHFFSPIFFCPRFSTDIMVMIHDKLNVAYNYIYCITNQPTHQHGQY